MNRLTDQQVRAPCRQYQACPGIVRGIVAAHTEATGKPIGFDDRNLRLSIDDLLDMLNGQHWPRHR